MVQKIIAADSQVLNSVQFCMRAMKYSHEMSLRSIQPKDYLERGDLLHRMLQTYYTLKKYRARWTLNRPHPRKSDAVVTHADVVDIAVRVGRHHAIRLALDLTEVEVVIATFREYCTHRASDGWDRIIAVEQVGSFILFENEEYKIIYQVKIDLVVELQNLPVVGVDHKSTKRRSEDVIGPDGSTFPPEALLNQFMGYCAALGTNNFIKNEIGFQKTLAPKDKFIRKLISYSNDNIAEWKDEAAYWLIKAEKESAIGVYPRNLTSCDKYSGCDYRFICKSDRTLRPQKIDLMFEKKAKWDVGTSL
jgi:hypothetical protein